jgi:hypothetical protein
VLGVELSGGDRAVVFRGEALQASDPLADGVHRDTVTRVLMSGARRGACVRGPAVLRRGCFVRVNRELAIGASIDRRPLPLGPGY